MLKIIREADDPELMERVWFFRHDMFVDDMGWEELRRLDHRERDEFDTGDAYHAVLLSGRNVVAYSRLLPTKSSHLTGEFCRRLGVGAPAGPCVFEWSRCAVARNAPRIGGHSASDILMTGVLECLVELEVRAVVFLTYQRVTRMMRRRGYPVRPLCSMVLPNGDLVEAVTSGISFDLLGQHRKRHGITTSLLEWGRCAKPKQMESSAAA